MAFSLIDPFRELEDLHREFNKMWQSRTDLAMQTPTTDVYTADDDSAMVVEAHLPGFDKKDVNLDVHDGSIELRAQKEEKEEKGKGKKKYVVRESSSSFYRRIGLPQNVDSDNVKAEFKNGVLKVTLPFKELPKPKTVNIE